MLSIFILALREGFEAALVVGIVLGTLRQCGCPEGRRFVWAAVAAGVAVSLVAAVLLIGVGQALPGPAESAFDGIALAVSAALIAWMVLWLSTAAPARCGALAAKVRDAACARHGAGLFAVTFVAVAREGLELAIFLTAVAGAGTTGRLLAGTLAGLASAAALAWVLFATAIRFDVRLFFRATSVLLVIFAAGLVAKAVREFNEVGWIPPVVAPVWDTHAVLSEASPAGMAATTLLGYFSTPSLTMVAGHALYLAVVGAAAVGASTRARRQAH